MRALVSSGQWAVCMAHGAEGSGELYRLGAPLAKGTACRARTGVGREVLGGHTFGLPTPYLGSSIFHLPINGLIKGQAGLQEAAPMVTPHLLHN